MTSLINFMTISFRIRKKCNIGSARCPIVPIVMPNAQQNVIKPIKILIKTRGLKKKKIFNFTQKICTRYITCYKFNSSYH